MKPGIYQPEQLNNETYHALEAVSKSDLDKINRSPAHYKYAKENPTPPTPAMERGTAVHMAVLEPDEFRRHYAPEFDPEQHPEALRSVDEIKNAIVQYNATLEGVITNDDIIAAITAHNAKLPQPIKARSRADKVAALMETGGEYADQDKLDALNNDELKAVVEDYNNGLPAPLKATKKMTRCELISEVSKHNLKQAETYRAAPCPVTLDGNKPDLIDKLLAANPDAQILDKLASDYGRQHAGAKFLPREEHEKYLGMRDAVMAHPAAAKLFGAGAAEQSVIADLTGNGTLVKCRPDWYNPARRIVIDVKTTADARPEPFARSVVNYRYDVQAAWYKAVCEAAGLEFGAFVFVAVEDKPPYGVRVYYASEAMLDIGWRKAERDFQTYLRCQAKNEWPAYPITVDEIDLPSWEKTKEL